MHGVIKMPQESLSNLLGCSKRRDGDCARLTLNKFRVGFQVWGGRKSRNYLAAGCWL